MNKFIAFILFILNMGAFLSGQCSNPDDYTALRALYLSTDGDNWTDNSGWPDAETFIANPTMPSGTDMELWYRVSCEIGRGLYADKIRYVNLDNNNLNGSLPPELSLLTEVNSLRFRSNMLSGDISVLSVMEALNDLDMSMTNVTGDISALSGTVINVLLLDSTGVSGDISALGSLKGLENVALENTNVSGDIVVFHGYPNLITLYLNNTNVDGDISSLQGTPALFELRLSNTNVTGNLSNIVLTDRIITLQLENLNLTGCWSSWFKSKCGTFYLPNFDGNQGVISNQGWLELCDSGVGQCSTNCPENISRTCLNRFGCTLVGGTYEAVDSVRYSGRYSVSQGVAVALNGGEGVELSNGFNVHQGGLLQIEVEGCMQN